MDLLEHGQAEPSEPGQGGRPRTRRRTAGIAAAVVALGLLGVGGVSYAASNQETPAVAPAAQATPSPTTSPDKSPDKSQDRERHIMPWRGPKLGGAFGGGGALHGEFTVKKREGGYQTVAMQNGTVTAVSASSITVKSEDGYTRTYTVNSQTIVRATREGINAIKTGHTVFVTATVSGDTATATHIGDRSLIKPR